MSRQKREQSQRRQNRMDVRIAQVERQRARRAAYLREVGRAFDDQPRQKLAKAGRPS